MTLILRQFRHSKRLRTAFLFPLLWSFALRASTQSFTVRLLDAASGKPIKHTNLTFVWCPDCFQQVVVALDGQGTGQVTVPQGARDFAVFPGPKPGKDPYRVAFLSCNSWTHERVTAAEVLEVGVVPRNACSATTVSTHAGTLVFWGKSIPWWMPNFQ